MAALMKDAIKPNEVFLYVPNSLLITVESAKASEIGKVFKNHDYIFKAN